MNENEIMEVNEVTEEQPEVIEEERSGMSTGLAVLIGAGLALAGAKAFKFAKGKYAVLKAKREAAKNTDGSKEEPNDAVIEEVKDSEK